MDGAAPAAGAAAEKKRPLLRRVPTSLIVTLLGIVLTAWLLPAFTRQWDDRQKAHEIQAGLVADIASATSRVLVSANTLWSLPACEEPVTPSGAPAPPGFRSASPASVARFRRCERRQRTLDRRAVAKDAAVWSLPSVQLEARLQAYVDPKVVTAWQLYSWFIDRFARIGGVQAAQDLAAASQSSLEAPAARQSGAILRLGEDILYGANFRIPRGDFSSYPSFIQLKHRLRRYTPAPYKFVVIGPGNGTPGVRDMEADLLSFEKEIAHEVLTSHITGYSTTTHDLLRDLVP